MSHRIKVVPHRRRRDGKTDYRQRLRLLKSGEHRLVVRKSNNGVLCQVVDYNIKGDKVLVASTYKELSKLGWNVASGNLPGAYLTGLLCGKKAVEKGIEKAVLDSGLYKSVKGSRLYATLKGAVDAGLEVPHSEDILPDENRISGKHIADYATKLKKENPTNYKKLFSGYLKSNNQPENLPALFESVKTKILGSIAQKKARTE